MSEMTKNPFDLNRASDFSDMQINNYWVDYGDDGLVSLIEPESKTSIHLLGGKGSGKTHLMRYCSYPVQKLRHESKLLSGLQTEGYVGIFSRANTFDTGRFQGKGQPTDTWGILFNYYFEIRICEQLVLTLLEISEEEPSLSLGLDTAAQDARNLFDQDDIGSITSIASFHEALVSLRKEIDRAVNNCAFTRTLDVPVRVTPGNLLFGLPELVCKHVKELKSIQFLYLIDEIENFSADKQEFINTLIRHRAGPCSFRIGARLYGVKSQKNFGSDEENKEGSEYKKILLDEAMRAQSGVDGYISFSKRLCIRRLVDSKILNEKYDEEALVDLLDGFFEQKPTENFYKSVTNEIVKEGDSADRKYFRKLFTQLKDGLNQLKEQGITSLDDITEATQNLYCTEYPLLEKVNIFMFYKDWYQKKDLKESARRIGLECELFRQKREGADSHKHVYGHFSRDLLAQLYRDYSRRTTPMYAGLDAFIQMSAGVPRNLLIILHNTYKWARFNGEQPFGSTPISIESQCEAILESSNFFFEEDARPGTGIPRLKGSIAKLCEYLREVRYSSKPVEPSPLAFSLDESAISAFSREGIQQAENWSYIYQIPKGRPNANTQRVDSKYQLNPMISPKWDLPIGRRGDVRLPRELVEAIFGEKMEVFEDEKEKYIDGLNAPSFGNTSKQDNKTFEMDLGS